VPGEAAAKKARSSTVRWKNSIAGSSHQSAGVVLLSATLDGGDHPRTTKWARAGCAGGAGKNLVTAGGAVAKGFPWAAAINLKPRERKHEKIMTWNPKMKTTLGLAAAGLVVVGTAHGHRYKPCCARQQPSYLPGAPQNRSTDEWNPGHGP